MYLEYVFIFFSAFSFIIYAVMSFFSSRLISEYQRWGYSKSRPLIAYLQLLGSIGLFLGIYYPFCLTIVSFLLFLMMIVAMITRLKIKDTALNTLPSIFYAVLNFIIFYNALLKLL